MTEWERKTEFQYGKNVHHLFGNVNRLKVNNLPKIAFT